MVKVTFASMLAVASAGGEVDLTSDAFAAFKERFGKQYESDEDEHFRRNVYAANLEFIDRENAKDHSYQLGTNEFTDLTLEEFHARLGFRKPTTRSNGQAYLGTHVYDGEPLVDAVDWVEKGAVTPVKDQGQCGSCWAFSTIGSLEGAWELASGKLVSLSEQQLVECSKSNNGCNGGTMDAGFQFLEQAGSCTEDSYPYTAGTNTPGSCKQSCDLAVPKNGVTGYKDVDRSEQSLLSALMKGPVSVAIEADKQVFSMYKSGVLTGNCGTQLDHGVLAVGYGEDKGMKYWKVKNSWGASWGENGYIRLQRGKNEDGECGILSDPSYPVVSSGALLV